MLKKRQRTYPSADLKWRVHAVTQKGSIKGVTKNISTRGSDQNTLTAEIIEKLTIPILRLIAKPKCMQANAMQPKSRQYSE